MGRGDTKAVADRAHAGTGGGDKQDLVVQVVPYFPPHLGGTEVVAEAKTADDEANPLPEFVQTNGRKTAEPAEAELPSIV